MYASDRTALAAADHRDAAHEDAIEREAEPRASEKAKYEAARTLIHELNGGN